MSKSTLNILWTTGDMITSEKMILMYARNSSSKGWWKTVNIIIWGASSQLVSESVLIQEKIKMAIHTGVNFSACKGCTDQLGVSEQLIELGIDVKYLGGELTELLSEDEALLTV